MAGRNESTMVWTAAELESLRLCRNRAYHKVNTKRRQHLPASLSSFTLREWQAAHPGDKFSAKYIIAVYNRHFEQGSAAGGGSSGGGERRGRKRQAAASVAQQQQEQQQQEEEEKQQPADGDKKEEVPESVSEPVASGDGDREAPVEEEATTSADVISAPPDADGVASPSSATTTPADVEAPITRDGDGDLEEAPRPPSGGGGDQEDPAKLLDEVHDEFAPESGGVEAEEAPEEDQSGWACERHWMHMFRDGGGGADGDRDADCRRTEELLRVRERLQDVFPGCDVHQVKKPKGFSAAALRAWRALHPDSEENIKSISVKFAKYDKKFERPPDANGGLNDGIRWTTAMLAALQKSRLAAEKKAGDSPTAHMLTRKWKEEWRRLNPQLDVEWKAVVARYNLHFGSLDLLQDAAGRDGVAGGGGERDGLGDDGGDGGGKVKGFRNWTARTKLDLLETHRAILRERADLEPGSSDYNKLLLQRFQKLHPKCMESSRSIYSKVQSVEKELQNGGGPAVVRSVSAIPAAAPPLRKSRSRGGSDDDASARRDDESKEDENSDKNDGDDVSHVNGADVSAPSPSEAADAAGSGVVAEANAPHSIDGFEEWSLTMIRDFIACMDSTRRKFAALKEKNPTGNVKLVPLLLEEWRKLYPETGETVKTFLVRIKHLKQQKDTIKRSLFKAGLLPKVEGKAEGKKRKGGRRANGQDGGVGGASTSDGGEFKWHKSMIDDVVQARRRALEIKEQGMKRGRKLSFHQLWASEFKKVHPGSTFTSNNLSVHLWTWRKQQQRLGRGDPLAGEPQAVPLPSASASSRPSSATSTSGWTNKLKLQLVELGRKVEASLSDPETPNEQKVLGFSNMLHEEWQKQHPRRSDTARALNMMYCKVIKEGVDLLDHAKSASSSSSVERRLSSWTPRYNRALRECVEEQDAQPPVSYAVYGQRVIERWRRRFPLSGESDLTLKQRIGDLVASRDDAAAESNNSNAVILPDLHEPPSGRAAKARSASCASMTNSVDAVKDDAKEEVASSESKKPSAFDLVPGQSSSTRVPNARGQMCWNKQTIRDLFRCHQRGLAARRAGLASMSKKEAPLLSTLVHEGFLRLHPYCKLTPSILMAKLYCWKNALNKGTLELEMDDGKEEEEEVMEVKQEVPEATTATTTTTDRVSGDKGGGAALSVTEVPRFSNAGGRDIVYRTWSQAMMDNLVKTRKAALAKKQKLLEQGRLDVQLLDLWYEEFVKLHPDYKSTKKNLMQKFKWYRARMKKMASQAVNKTGPPMVAPMVGEPRVGSGLEIGPAQQQQQQQPLTAESLPVRIRNVRKDVFLHVKALMEESRIFLPMKLPQEPELKPPTPGSDALAPLQFTISPLPTTTPSPAHLQPQLGLGQRDGALATPPPLSTRPFTSDSAMQASLNTVTASSALAQFHNSHKDIPPALVPSVPDPNPLGLNSLSQGRTELPLNLSLPSLVGQPATPTLDENPDEGAPAAAAGDKKDTIKLPGGATLVAVTDRNADALLKPKPVEKPHVTITIGEKSKIPGMDLGTRPAPATDQDDARAAPSPVVLSIPRFPAPDAAMALQKAGPPPQLKLFGVDNGAATLSMQQQQGQQQPLNRFLSPYQFSPRAIFIPSRVKARLDEHGVGDLQFIQLLSVYERARDEYIDTLKRGYLAFFPYILGAHWKQRVPNSPMTGRKLALVVDLYVEEKNRGRVVTPEYLTKKPCQFVVTEQVLRQVLLTRAEVVRELEVTSARPVNSAIANVELCKRWAARFPELKMTAKQLISIHEMLTYDTSKSTASPEVECSLADVWRLMEKSVSRSEQAEKQRSKREESEDEDKYDEETVAMEQMQEWLMETQALSTRRVDVKPRPRLAVRNERFRWSLAAMASLEDCRLLGAAKWRLQRDRTPAGESVGAFICREWRRRCPKDGTDDRRILAKIARMRRCEKRRRRRRFERTFSRWRRACEEFSKAEELNQVIAEEQPVEAKAEADERADEEADAAFSGRLTSLSKIASLQIASNTQRNFHDDEDVLGYIGEVQRLGKGNHPITWTPDVIRDLVRARQLARSRKREWEAWATREFGGVGFAYNNPEVKNVKVDDMFKEEWCKLRPAMSGLSIWTLVSYARKYDNLKKQLIIDNGQTNQGGKDAAAAAAQAKDGQSDGDERQPEVTATVQKKPFHINVFFPDSAIPKFDLEELERLPDVPDEFRDLLVARQRAKERQAAQRVPLALQELFLEEWRARHPDCSARVTGHDLTRRLWQLERSPGNVALVSPALLRRTSDAGRAWPRPAEDEAPRLLPRAHVFLEDPDDRRFGVSLRTRVRRAPADAGSRKRARWEQWVVGFSSDVYAVKALGLSVPALEKEDDDERDWDGEENEHAAAAAHADDDDDAAAWRFATKASVFERFSGTASKLDRLPSSSLLHNDKFFCAKSSREFHNVNNFLHHQSLLLERQNTETSKTQTT